MEGGRPMVMTMNPMGSHHDLFSKGVGVVMRGTRENSNVDIVSSTLGSDVEAMSMKVGGIGAMEIVRMGFTGRLRSKCGHLVVENDVTLGTSLHQDHRPRDESVEESSGEGDVGVVNRDSLDNKVDRAVGSMGRSGCSQERWIDSSLHCLFKGTSWSGGEAGGSWG